MFGSEILEVALGLVFIYLILSLICSSFSELISRLFAMRSSNLEQALRTLLTDARAEDLYNHPLVGNLARTGVFDKLVKREGRPSYIPARAFALALIDLAVPADRPSRTLSDIRTSFSAWPDAVKKPVLSLIDAAEGDIAAARQNVEAWFDDAMDRASGWYKRKIELILLGTALGLSIFLNADSIMIANTLVQDGRLRAAIVTAAEEAAKSPTRPGVEGSFEEIKKAQAQIQSLQLPLGWAPDPNDPRDPRRLPADFVGGLTKVIGLILTTLALSLGAPFWFDTLNKLVNLRSTGNQPRKHNDEEVSTVVDYPAASR